MDPRLTDLADTLAEIVAREIIQMKTPSQLGKQDDGVRDRDDEKDTPTGAARAT